MGKMLLLSFENSEDDVISEILSILERKMEYIRLFGKAIELMKNSRKY